MNHAVYGPTGTWWSWTDSQLSDAERDGLKRLLYWLGSKFRPFPSPQGGGGYVWVVPEGSAPPLPPEGALHMRWIHATVNAKYGDNETITHTLNFRTAPAADAAQDVAAIQTFANQLRDHWATFIKTAGPSGQAPAALLTSDVVYQDVTAAYLEQNAPATITTRPSPKTGRPVKVFDYPRPEYLVETQYATFDGTVKGSSVQSPLPYEVACVISLGTGLRGPRNRGRLYLGGLTVDAMLSGGQFKPAYIDALNGSFGQFVHAMNTDTGARLHVVSRAYATSVGVNSVTAGRTPDSQRRRRRSRLEAYPVPIAT